MRKRSLSLLIPGLLLSAILLTSCGKEHFVDAREVFILNPDTTMVEIFVNGEKALDFAGPKGEVYLNSGDYELVAKRAGTEVSKAQVSLSAKSDKNEYDQVIWDLKGGRNWALLDMRALYFDDRELEVEGKWSGQNLLEIDCSTYHFYYPWSSLPSKIYAVEGSTADIFQLFELPADKPSMSDEEIVKWVEETQPL